MYVCMYVCMYINAHIYMYTHMYMYICICICICIYIFMLIFPAQMQLPGLQVVFDLQTLFRLSGVVTQARIVVPLALALACPHRDIGERALQW